MVLCELRKSTSKYLFYQSKWWILGKTKLGLSNCCSNCTSNHFLAPAFFGNYYGIKEPDGFAVRWEWHVFEDLFHYLHSFGMKMPSQQELQGQQASSTLRTSWDGGRNGGAPEPAIASDGKPGLCCASAIPACRGWVCYCSDLWSKSKLTRVAGCTASLRSVQMGMCSVMLNLCFVASCCSLHHSPGRFFSFW